MLAIEILVCWINIQDKAIYCRAVVVTVACLSTVATPVSRLITRGASGIFTESKCDTVKMVCRQSKIRDCRNNVDDRVSTTALIYCTQVCEKTLTLLSLMSTWIPKVYLYKMKAMHGLGLFGPALFQGTSQQFGGPGILLVESQKGPEKVMGNWKCHRKSVESWGKFWPETGKCHV